MLPRSPLFVLLRRRALSLGLLALGLVLLLAVACQNGDNPRDFEVQTFDGERFRLSEHYEDNVVVINFWYPSCPPCREEMPEFQAAWESLEGEPVSFIGLFVPRGFDTEQSARDFVAEFGLTFHFATDGGETIASAYDIEYYPTTWFIDRGGRTIETYVSTLNAEKITAVVREFLEG